MFPALQGVAGICYFMSDFFVNPHLGLKNQFKTSKLQFGKKFSQTAVRVKGKRYFSRNSSVDFPHHLSAFVICFNIFAKKEDQNISQNVSHPRDGGSERLLDV